MDRVNIDGILYEKEKISGWEDMIDPKAMYLTYLGNMYKLERVKDRPEDVTIETTRSGYRSQGDIEVV